MDISLGLEPEMHDETTEFDWNVSHALFGQELVGYIISSCNSSFQMPALIEKYPQQLRNPFSNSVKNAVNCILFYTHRKNRYSFKHLVEADKTVINYIKSVHKLEDNYFVKGFNVTNFLYYCVDIAILAAAFLKFDLKEAPRISVVQILNTLESYDVRKNFSMLDTIAKEFPYVSNTALKKALNKLKKDLEFSLTPLAELSEQFLSRDSSGDSSETEIVIAAQ